MYENKGSGYSAWNARLFLPPYTYIRRARLSVFLFRGRVNRVDDEDGLAEFLFHLNRASKNKLANIYYNKHQVEIFSSAENREFCTGQHSIYRLARIKTTWSPVFIFRAGRHIFIRMWVYFLMPSSDGGRKKNSDKYSSGFSLIAR